MLVSKQLKDVRIDESNPSGGSSGLSPSPKSQELRRLLETSPLRFSFQDGVVAELCPDPQEDPWALNIKRGLLSALQNSMDSLQGTQSVQEVRALTAHFQLLSLSPSLSLSPRLSLSLIHI